MQTGPNCFEHAEQAQVFEEWAEIVSLRQGIWPGLGRASLMRAEQWPLQIRLGAKNCWYRRHDLQWHRVCRDQRLSRHRFTPDRFGATRAAIQSRLGSARPTHDPGTESGDGSARLPGGMAEQQRIRR